MSLATARFADLARAYCQWAEGAPGSERDEALTARLHLARLHAQALELSDSASWNGDAPKISHEAWKATYKRFGALPVNYYGECLHPLEVPASDTALGDLADDLADIWRDVRRGLDVYDAGDIEGATFAWHQSFTIHWGMHAASALYILQCWIREHCRAWRSVEA